MTDEALLRCMLRYVLTLAGPRLPGDLLNKIDTRIINMAPRRNTGRPINTRLKAPYFVAGTRSIRLLYRRHYVILLQDSVIMIRKLL